MRARTITNNPSSRPGTAHTMIRLSLVASGALLLLVGLFAAPVSAEGFTLPLGTVVYGEPGSTVELGSVPIDPSRTGSTCSWTATASSSNQHSTHVGNDIIVRSGGSDLVLSGVEDSAGKVTSTSGSVSLGSSVHVLLRLGPDGAFSAGVTLNVTFDGCQAATTTTTTEATTTTTEATTTTTEATTTTAVVPTSSETVPQTEPTTPATVQPSLPTTAVPLASTTTVPTISVLPKVVTTSPQAQVTVAPILPVTGPEHAPGIAAAGLVLLGAGLVLVRTSKGHGAELQAVPANNR